MATFEIDLGGIGNAVGSILDRVDAAASETMNFGLELIAREAKTLAPKGSTGVLGNSIRAGTASGSFSSGGLTGHVIADAPHAAAHEYGSGLYGDKGAKYPIRPKNKRALRWAVQGSIGAGGAAGSGFAFSRGVMHPGVKATAYLARAMEAKLPVIERELAAAVEDAILGPKT